MTLSYDSTLDDVTETSVRLYQRGKTYASRRWGGAVLSAVLFAFFGLLGFHSHETVNLPLICFAAAAWGAGLYWLTYNGSVRRRLKKYIVAQLPGAWPRPTRYEIKDGQLRGTTAGAPVSLALSDLAAVREDAGYLVLDFGGPQGLCVIPLRAFASAAEKAEFLAALGRG